MADETKLVISLDLILRNLERTLKGLSAVEKQLKSVAAIKIGGTTNFDKAAASAQRLQLQQQKLAIQSQELTNRQERARQQADRLALSQLKLEQAFIKTANAEKRVAATTVRETQRKTDEVRRINEQTARNAEREERIRARAAKSLADVQIREGKRSADQLVRGLEQSREASLAFAKSVGSIGNSLRSAGQGIASLGFVLTGTLTAPLVALATASTQASITMDSLRRGLTAIVGSADEAGKQLERLTQIAKLPGIGFQEAIQGSIRLQAVGFSARDAEQALIQFSNAIALTGGGRDELNRVTVQLGQLAAKGKVLSQDLRPIIEAAPAVGRALKQAFGTVNADDIAELSGSSEQFLKTLIDQLEQLPRATAGARTSFENFRDSVFRASTALGDALLPALTKLAEIALPIIESIASAFRALPVPIQTVVVVFGAFLAALGPVSILVGVLALGIGRLLVAYSQLKLQALQAGVAVDVFAASTVKARVAAVGLGQALRRAGGPLLTIAVLILEAVLAYKAFNQESEEAVSTSKEDVVARTNQNRVLRDQIEFLEQLSTLTKANNADQQRFLEIQQDLDAQSRGRLETLTSESERIQTLIDLKREQLRLGEIESQSRAAAIVTELAKAIDAQQEAQAKLNKAKEAARGPEESTFERQVRALNIMDASAAAIERQRQGFIDTAKASDELKKTEKTVNDLGQSLKDTAEATEQTVDAFLQQARTGLVAEDALIKVKKALDDLAVSAQNSAAAVIDGTEAQIKALKRLKSESERDPFVILAKTGAEALDATLERIKAVTTNTDDAAKALQNYIELYPELRDAVEKAGGVRKAVEELFKTPKADTGTALRNAQERLRQQLLDVAQAGRDKDLAAEQAANEEAIRQNELAFGLRLQSYRDYLQNRALLTTTAIDQEIRRQRQLVVDAQKNAAELFRQASQAGIPQVERINRQIAANQATEDAIKAETKLAELESRRADVFNDLAVALADLNRQQEADVRQLQIEYAELQGRIEDALKAQVIERFRERLSELARQQKSINEQLNDGTRTRTAEEREALKVVLQRNQAEIDLINFRQQQGDSLAVLTTAEKFLEDSKQRQSDLEEQLRFDVEFRGKTEVDAIQERLRGEEQLKQRLLINRDIVQDEIDKLESLGLAVPERLSKFVDQINRDVQSLGRLSFIEQFRLAEDEFNRINDERLDKIADVERAIRRRTIAEAEGLLLIRRINGEYIGDLEKQVELQKQIAAESNDPQLAARARQNEQTAKDANDALEDFDTQLRSVSIDSLQRGLSDFFSSLSDRTTTAKEKLIDAVNSIAKSITDFIAEDFSRRIIESIFGTPDQQGNAVDGLIGGLKRLLGIGGSGGIAESAKAVDTGFGTAGKAVETGQITAAATTLATAGTTASAALVTGGTSAATAMSTSAVTLATSITSSAAAFATAVVAAGAAFAATVAAGSAAQAAGDIGSSLAGAFGAATGLFPAVPGGLVRVVEGGYPEAILTTDPAHAVRQTRILQQYLKQTRGLFGRIPGFATGGLTSARDAETRMLQSLSPRASIPTPSPQMQLASAEGGDTNLRILNLFDKRRVVGDHLRSSEGAQDIMNVISENSDEIGRRLRLR